jgi:hypothetical protein
VSLHETSLITGRRGKNRCEGDPTGSNHSCRRCLANGTACVFTKASDRRDRRGGSGGSGEGLNNEADRYDTSELSNVQADIQCREERQRVVPRANSDTVGGRSVIELALNVSALADPSGTTCTDLRQSPNYGLSISSGIHATSNVLACTARICPSCTLIMISLI